MLSHCNDIVIAFRYFSEFIIGVRGALIISYLQNTEGVQIRAEIIIVAKTK